MMEKGIDISSVDLNKKIKNLDKSIKSDYKNNKKDHEKFDGEITRLSDLTDELVVTSTKNCIDLEEVKKDTKKFKKEFIFCYVLVLVNILATIALLLTNLLQ